MAMKDKPCCRTCGYKNAYYSNGHGLRFECYCDHPHAGEAFRKYGGASKERFISFSVKCDTEPTIKTSPRWCPLKRMKEDGTDEES